MKTWKSAHIDEIQKRRLCIINGMKILKCKQTKTKKYASITCLKNKLKKQKATATVWSITSL